MSKTTGMGDLPRGRSPRALGSVWLLLPGMGGAGHDSALSGSALCSGVRAAAWLAAGQVQKCAFQHS